LTMENKGFKLLEEKIEKMISLVHELRKEREDLKESLKANEAELNKLKEELEIFKTAGAGSFSMPDLKELLDAVQEERTLVRDSIRGTLRLINE